MLAERIQFISQTIDLWAVSLNYCVDVIQNGLNLLLVGFAGYRIQICKERPRISADSSQFSPNFCYQSVGVVRNSCHLVGDFVQTRALLRSDDRPRWKPACGIAAC